MRWRKNSFDVSAPVCIVTTPVLEMGLNTTCHTELVSVVAQRESE